MIQIGLLFFKIFIFSKENDFYIRVLNFFTQCYLLILNFIVAFHINKIKKYLNFCGELFNSKSLLSGR